MEMPDAAAMRQPASTEDAVHAPWVCVVAAWCMLAGIHGVVRITGFPRLYRLIRRWPTLARANEASTRRRAELICAAMTRARLYYFRYTWCLHSAAAAVALLRLCGVGAELVIGVRRIPFRAHAWVEASGLVVLNGRRDLGTTYTVITRC